jgi:hypothetical protein
MPITRTPPPQSWQDAALLMEYAPETAAERDRLKTEKAKLIQQVKLLVDHLETRDSMPQMRALRVKEARAVLVNLS